MGKMGGCSLEGMKQLKKQMEKLQEQEANAFIEACAKELAARLLAELIRRTPVGHYSKEVQVTAKRDSKHHKKGDVYTKRVNLTGKTGGTLRRGWLAETHEEAENGKGSPTAQDVKAFVDSIEIQHQGNMLIIEIKNPVSYAPYVNYGHKQTKGRYVPALGKKLKKGWVVGQFMMEKSEKNIQEIAPKVLEAKLKKFLEECMG